MSWIIRRIFNDKTVGYLYQKVRPVIQEDMADLAKTAVLDLLSDEEVAEFAAKYADALVDREKRRVFGAIGGITKGINYATKAGKQPVGFDLSDIQDEDGNISLAKGFNWFLQNRNKLPSLGAIGAGYMPVSGSGAQNAPD